MDSDDSMCSVSSRSAREIKQRACVYFYSDKSTGITRDIRGLIKGDPKCGNDHEIQWECVQEKVCIVATGGKDGDIKEAQVALEEVMGKENMSPRRAIEIIHGERVVPKRRRSVKAERPKIANLAPLPFGVNIQPLAKEIGDAIRVEVKDWEYPEVPVAAMPAAPVLTPVPQPTGRVPDPILTNLDAQKSIDLQLENAVNDRERGHILLGHARRYLQQLQGPSETSILLHPAYNIYISKADKIAALGNGTNPRKLQEQLLLKVFGNDYIASHSARGQRASSGGNPAACAETMEAIDAFVRSKYKGLGVDVPKITRTYNDLAKNVRVTKGYRSGRYRYVSQKRRAAKEARNSVTNESTG